MFNVPSIILIVLLHVQCTLYNSHIQYYVSVHTVHHCNVHTSGRICYICFHQRLQPALFWRNHPYLEAIFCHHDFWFNIPIFRSPLNVNKNSYNFRWFVWGNLKNHSHYLDRMEWVVSKSISVSIMDPSLSSIAFYLGCTC